MALLRPGRCCSRRQGGCLQHRTDAQRRPKGQDAGGTPALPGDAVPAVPWGVSGGRLLRKPTCTQTEAATPGRRKPAPVEAISLPWWEPAANSVSSITATPSWRALTSLPPASSPATTKEVFLLTAAVTRPPLRVIIRLASSRVSVASLPVTTTCCPWRSVGADSACLSSKFRPARRSFSTIRSCPTG